MFKLKCYQEEMGLLYNVDFVSLTLGETFSPEVFLVSTFSSLLIYHNFCSLDSHFAKAATETWPEGKFSAAR